MTIGNDVTGSGAKEPLKPIWYGLEYIFKLGFSIFTGLIEILSRSHPVNAMSASVRILPV